MHAKIGGSAFRENAAARDEAGGRIRLMTAFSLFVAAAALAGCTRQEKVLDVETPGGGIEVYEEKPVTD